MQEEIFMNHTILLSEEIVIRNFCLLHPQQEVHIKDIWTQKYVVVLMFDSAFKITKFSTLKNSQQIPAILWYRIQLTG